MTITTKATDRKQLVRDISDYFEIPAVYLRMPTYAYQIGKLTVNRDGSISAEDAADLEAVKPFLIEMEYIDAENTEEANDQEPTITVLKEESAEEITEPDSETPCLMLGFPYDDKPVSVLRNLIYILYSKQTLLNHSVGTDSLKISDLVVETLKRTLPETPYEFADLMNNFVSTGDLQGIEFKDDTVSITYSPIYTPDWYNILLHLTRKIFETAAAATRIHPDHQQPESEKYVMRSWLVRIGMGTTEYKTMRQRLLKNLSGHSAFPSEEAAAKHREKYARIRREHRATATECMEDDRSEY